MENDEMIWLDDGFHEFVECASIRSGHMLFFRYERNSTFLVCIMDTESACDVDYPIEDEELHNGDNDETERHSIHKDSVTDQEEGSTKGLCDGKTANSDKKANREAIRRKQNASISVQVQDLKELYDGKKLKITIQRANSESGKEEEEIEIYVSRNLFGATATSQERERAIRAIEIFQPKNPCFMVIMRQYNFASGNLYVPVGFATEYLSQALNHVKIEHSDGREWIIEFQRHGKNSMSLKKGCYEFWNDNDVKNGDVCIFELKDYNTALLSLSILRVGSN
ncbi:hypothetical protein COLO4_11743 [Corchorus olitorius]|uniref:TF-B3 domain-containing protein n=1 Tax=Corchorus olitorius TaxID=93759 RepID=A0A1R3K3C1_9ROSI|nr:hypothetical protein COLO4_11743 [Corchorus olitorius]